MTESRGESFDRLPNKNVAWEGEAPAEPLSLLGRSKCLARQTPRHPNSLYFIKRKSFTALRETACFRGAKDDFE